MQIRPVNELTRQDCRAKRKRLHRSSPRCHWCGVATVMLPPTQNDPNMATIDHIKNRVQCGTREEYRAGKNMVLACSRCNLQRDQAYWREQAPVHARKYRNVDAGLPQDCWALVTSAPSWPLAR